MLSKNLRMVYNDGELELNVSINNETVWLNRNIPNIQQIML